MSETPYMRRLMLRLTGRGVRIFRNNVGALQDRFGVWVRYGVCNPGGSDLIGWKSVEITPEMVGARAALFVAVEVKSQRGKPPTDEQIAFMRAVRDAGGISLLAREGTDSIEEQGFSSTGVLL